MPPTPLISILTENKLNGDNFQEWKRNLLIVLNCEKHKFVLDETSLLAFTYNLGNKAFTMTQLMKELQSYELMLNASKSVQEKPEANLAVGTSSFKGKQKAKGKKKPTKSFVPPRVDRKKANNEMRSLRDRSLSLRTGDGSYVLAE
ncbi:hypothetical protein Golax_003957, partial [Gossypium laxum]|nr:hypothetical protein [Gossypium laxum]